MFRIMHNINWLLLFFHVLWEVSSIQDNFIDNSPRFLDQVPNITRTVGRDALLTCNVDQLKGYKVAWVQVDTQTILTIHKQVITRNPRISLLHDDHRSWHLQIKSLQENDRGWYMCQVNTDPMRYIQGYLDVVVPPDIIDKKSSGDLIVLEGDDVTLECRAKGHPQPTIIWRREDSEDIVLDTDKSVGEVRGEQLVMRKVSRLHMGSYLCIATNNVPPSISKRIHLKVHFPPVAWVPQQLESAYIGQELTIECHTEAFPMSINYWTNNRGEMIVSGGRFDPILAKSSYKVYMKLRIKQVAKEDFGNFQCIAKNSLGETDGVIKVYEIEPPPTYKPKVIDYEESANVEQSEIPIKKNSKKHKNHTKLPDNRRTHNDIIDQDLRAKNRSKDLFSHSKETVELTSSHFEVPDTDTRKSNENLLSHHKNFFLGSFNGSKKIYNENTLIFLIILIHVLS